MAKIHDLFIVELAEVIKGYGNNPDDADPFRLSEFYRFYELPNIAVSRENFEKMRPVERCATIESEPQWNNHTVACLLADLYGDPCACNYNGIDEWLPSKCELLDACPDPVGVACWEQFLKHRAERRTDG